MQTPLNVLLPIDHPYEQALREILSPLGEYKPVFDNNVTFEEVFITYGNTAIIRSVNHMGILQLFITNSGRLKWSAFVFYKSANHPAGAIMKTSTLDIEPFLDKNGDFKIIGYLQL